MNKEKTVHFFTHRVTRNMLFWLVFTLMYYPFGSGKPYYYPLLLVVIFMVFGIPAYFNNLFLIPRFLLRKRYGMYTLLLLFTTLYATTAGYFVLNALTHFPSFYAFGKMSFCWFIFPSLLTFITLAFGKFMGDAIQYKFENEELLRQQTESELEVLRSQVNPHFLFNALNTIYGMSLRAEAQTPDTVLKLSNILRHTLYESSGSVIGLDKEIAFLQEYIAFAKLRLTDQSRITLDIDVEEGDYKVAPLLLVPFVENAIKHGLGYDPYAWVKIALTVRSGKLLFECVNSVSAQNSERKGHSSGIGLKNVKRRLELLYKDHYELSIDANDSRYSVNLKLDLV